VAADFLELGELMCLDALERRESCGGPLPPGIPDRRKARRGATTSISAMWPPGAMPARERPERLVEPLAFEEVSLQTRSYK
jgi:succinate dehydrogenase / fumarate reductase flavoprotein subunit